MGCLLVLVVAATVLTGPPGKLTHAARTTSPAEAFWRAALPGTPMPEAIRELLRPAGTNALDVDARPRHHAVDADPPPMDFNYNYDRSSPRNRNEAAAPSAEVLDRFVAAGAARNDDAAASPTVFFLEEAVRVGGVLPLRTMIARDTGNAAAASSAPPLRVYTVRAVRAVDGCRFMVCRRDREAGEDDAAYGCRATGGPARAYVVGMVGERGETATAAVVCRTDTSPSPWSRRARAAFWLLGVKPGGAAPAAVCDAALDAQVIPVKKNDGSSCLV